MKSRVIAIAAISRERRALGKNNQLLWHLPGDLPRLKRLTTGHPVIMGSKTYESLPKRPLPERTNIVLTRDEAYDAPGAVVAHSPDEALATARDAPGSDAIYILGGAQVYTALLPYTDELDLTIVDDEPEADVFFPKYEHLFCQEKEEDRHEHDGLQYARTRWVRR